MAKVRLSRRKETVDSLKGSPATRRWVPGLETALSASGIVISLTTLVFTSPLLAEYWFPPLVWAKLVIDTGSQVDYDLANTGWSTAEQVNIEFDVFSTVTDINLRPTSDAKIYHKPDGGFGIVYPSLGPGEVFKIYITYKNPTGFAEQFGAVGAYSVRSNEGQGTIIYKEQN